MKKKLEPISKIENNSLSIKKELNDSTRTKSYIIKSKTLKNCKNNSGNYENEIINIKEDNEYNNLIDSDIKDLLNNNRFDSFNDNNNILLESLKNDLINLKNKNSDHNIKLPDNLSNYLENINSELNESRNKSINNNEKYDWVEAFKNKINNISIKNNEIIDESISEIKKLDDDLEKKEKEMSDNRNEYLSNASQENYDILKNKLFLTDIEKSEKLIKSEEFKYLNSKLEKENKLKEKKLKENQKKIDKQNKLKQINQITQLKKEKKFNKIINFIDYNIKNIGLTEEEKFLLKLNESQIIKYNKLKNNFKNNLKEDKWLENVYEKAKEKAKEKANSLYGDSYYLFEEKDNSTNNNENDKNNYLNLKRDKNKINDINKKLKQLKNDSKFYNNNCIKLIKERKIYLNQKLFNDDNIFNDISNLENKIKNYKSIDIESLKLEKNINFDVNLFIENKDKFFNNFNKKINKIEKNSNEINDNLIKLENKYNNLNPDIKPIENNFNDIQELINENYNIINKLNEFKTEDYNLDEFD